MTSPVWNTNMWFFYYRIPSRQGLKIPVYMAYRQASYGRRTLQIRDCVRRTLGGTPLRRVLSVPGQRCFVFILCFCLLACGRGGAQTNGELRVAAAADLTRAFTEVGRAFEKQTGQKVALIFGASGQLTQQIENGAPFDVFASANEDYIAQLDTKHLLLSGTRHVYAHGKLVLWTRKGGLPLPATLADLAGPRYARIAIANPQTAPYGMVAKQALEKAGCGSKMQSKLVTGENIQQAYQFAASGNADIAFVSRSLTRTARAFQPVPETLYPPLRQTLAVLQSSPMLPPPAALSLL